MGRIGTTEIVLIVIAIIILFGARRIPELMRSLGSGMREFKKGARGEVDEAASGQKETGKTGEESK
jgi:sec-independent protein translocase protein TatA